MGTIFECWLLRPNSSFCGGDRNQAQWLPEGMKVILSVFNSTPVAIQVPPRVTLRLKPDQR